MRKTALAFLLGLISSVAYANQPFVVEKQVLCSNFDIVIKSLAGPEHREEPIWAGSDGDDRYVITANKTTNNWTMLQITEGYACIIASGKNQALIFLKAKFKS